MIRHNTQTEGLIWQMIGLTLIWLNQHGMGLLGAACLILSAVVQMKTYHLRKREFRLKQAEFFARYDEAARTVQPGRESAK